MRLTQKLKNAIHAHAKDVFPHECCGLVIDGTYHACANVAADPLNHFEIDAADFVALSQMGNVDAIVHSHPNGTPSPSLVDEVQMRLHGVDWLICGCGVDAVTGEWYSDIQRHKPPKDAPLLGRDYVHGVQDCYTLVRDYYSRELGIDLPDFARIDNWWEDENHEPLYENNFAKAGFVQVDDLQAHDVILCRVGRTHHVNHALIYLGDGKLTSETAPSVVGNSLILHHPHSAMSRREIYGENWQKRTAMVVRHKQA